MTNGNGVIPNKISNTKDEPRVSLPAGTSFYNGLRKFSNFLNYGLAWIAGACMFSIVLLVVISVIRRAVYVPFSGTEELVGWLAATSTAFALGYTQINRGYVDIDALTQHFSPSVQRFLKNAILLVSILFFALVAWKITGYALSIKANGNLSETMKLSFYPLVFMLAFGFAGLTIALLTDLLADFFGEEETP